MIAAGMMMKDQGLIKTNVLCPNHLTEQFGQELLRFIPLKGLNHYKKILKRKIDKIYFS